MAKPGALIPTYGIEYALPAAADHVPSNTAFRVAVATAGSLMARYEGSQANDVELHYPAAGVYFEPGEFAAIWAPAVGAVTTLPAATVVLLHS